MYSLVRPILFRFDAEKAHHFTLNSLRSIEKLGLLPKVDSIEEMFRQVDEALAADPRHEELFIAWQVAHELRQAYHHKDLPAGRSAAEKVLATLPSCPIPEIARLAPVVHGDLRIAGRK